MSLSFGRIAVLGALLTAGCGDSPPPAVQCMSMGATSDIVANSALVSIQIYADGVACDGNLVATGAPAPIFSRTFNQGQAITLDVPPGRHTVTLSAYADLGGADQIGAGCVDSANFQPGQQVCIDLSIVMVDSSVPPMCQDETCPFDEFCGPSGHCEPGCKSNAECVQLASNMGGSGDGGMPALFCDIASHSCVTCTNDVQCGAGLSCCMGTCIAGGTCCTDANCEMPPAPTACRAPGVCSGIGGTCNYALKSGSKVCGGTCCNAMNGTCNSNCTLTCTGGFADCDGDPSNGCETNLAAASKKLCGAVCIAANTCCNSADCATAPMPAACYPAAGTCSGVGGTCSYTQNPGSQICNSNMTCCNPINGTCTAGTCALSCATGALNCNGTPADGCETPCDAASPSGACYGSGGVPTCCPVGMFNCDGNQANACECGTSCCTNPLTSASDCMVNNHIDGWTHNFAACYPLGVPGTFNGTTGTPGTGYAAQVALDAIAADTTQIGTKITTGRSCTTAGSNQVIAACKENDDGTGKVIDCTCWAYGSAGTNCKDPQDNISKPCSSFIGHTYHAVGLCACISVTDGTYN